VDAAGEGMPLMAACFGVVGSSARTSMAMPIAGSANPTEADAIGHRCPAHDLEQLGVDLTGMLVGLSTRRR
jgi:hypothetical protein